MNQAEIERAIASIAGRQHGVVARRQLRAVGLSKHHVQYRIGSGQLVRLHRGVYRVGPVEAARAAEMAAILACGDGSVLSHDTAARLFGLKPGAPSSSPLHVARANGYLRRPGLVIHRLPTLIHRDVTRVEGIPTTTAARTLWDLAASTPARDLERMFAVALDRGLTRRAELRRLMDRHKRAPGSGKLRWLVAANPSLTRSEAEDRLQGLVRSAGLPEPQTNAKVEGLEVDCYWPAQGLVVEVDGFAYHGSRAAFERDRRRDRRLIAAGMSVIRVTWRQLDQEPLAVVAQLAQALAAPSRR